MTFILSVLRFSGSLSTVIAHVDRYFELGIGQPTWKPQHAHYPGGLQRVVHQIILELKNLVDSFCIYEFVHMAVSQL